MDVAFPQIRCFLVSGDLKHVLEDPEFLFFEVELGLAPDDLGELRKVDDRHDVGCCGERERVWDDDDDGVIIIKIFCFFSLSL